MQVIFPKPVCSSTLAEEGTKEVSDCTGEPLGAESLQDPEADPGPLAKRLRSRHIPLPVAHSALWHLCLWMIKFHFWIFAIYCL